jgi:hypothetical protein
MSALSQKLRLATEGFVIVERVLGRAMRERLLGALGDAAARPGVRNLLQESPVVREIAASPAVSGLASKLAGALMFPVRAILFDKTPVANWSVAWHQDLAIAVRARRDAPGFVGWSTKAGVVHVLPPPEVLAGMVTIRLQLDECGPENGPLEVVPGSHRHGRLDGADAERLRAATRAVPCLVPVCGALVMRPLLLHASARARWPGRRRVLHLEYASKPLPHGLQWLSEDGLCRMAPWLRRPGRAGTLEAAG